MLYEFQELRIRYWNKKMANRISHRYNRLPLLPSGPGGVRQELVVSICRCKVKQKMIDHKNYSIGKKRWPPYGLHLSINYRGHWFTISDTFPNKMKIQNKEKASLILWKRSSTNWWYHGYWAIWKMFMVTFFCLKNGGKCPDYSFRLHTMHSMKYWMSPQWAFVWFNKPFRRMDIV